VADVQEMYFGPNTYVAIYPENFRQILLFSVSYFRDVRRTRAVIRVKPTWLLSDINQNSN